MRKILTKVLPALLSVIIAASAGLSAAAYIPYTGDYILGDVDNSGTVAAADALLTLQCAVGKLKLSYDGQDAADIDVNWEITASDALSVLQCSVGKIELSVPEHPYGQYELGFVAATGLKEYELYRIDGAAIHDENTGRNCDMMRLVVSMQGLINRNNDIHHSAVATNVDSTDEFWLNYMREEGATYADYTVVRLDDTASLLEVFMPFIKEQGIIAWDPDVPSTANVAGTICGLDGYLPVQYSTEETSLYYKLTNTYGVETKMNLCGMFEDAAEGKTIADTDIKSSGSSKNDAYLWAMDKYMNRCNPELLAYTLDGASSVPSNPVYSGGNAYNAQVTGIANQDYFILKQCFFFDLTSYSAEAPSDDPTQPIGTDCATLRKILEKRYEMAKGNFGTVQGFIPWHVKYTNSSYPAGTLDPPRLEWHFVETVGCYNCGIEADAAHPCWLSNGSLYSKYELRNEPNGNAPAKEVEYDPDTYYYSQFYAGDFDCSPWLKARAPSVWNPDNLGKVYSTYNYSTTLINRVPMIFDYVFGNQTEYEYLTGGEGCAYVMTATLFDGFVGKESSPSKRYLTAGDRAYIRYLKPYYQSQKLDIGGMLINGFSSMSKEECLMMNEIAVNGSFMYESNAASVIQVYDGTPYFKRMGVVSGNADNNELCCISLRAAIKTNKSTHFTAFGYVNNGTNYGDAGQLKLFLEDFEEYLSWKEPQGKYVYLDPETFIKLALESGEGSIYS